jgi:hypothetical protein
MCSRYFPTCLAAGFTLLPLLTVAAPVPKSPPAEKSRRADRYGDPLPEGAVARLGSVRFIHPPRVTSLAFCRGREGRRAGE